MNTLTYSDKLIIEELLQMTGGYVLKFSDATFTDFFDTVLRININDDKYSEHGESKAKRMRAFLKIADNKSVSVVLAEFLKLIPLQNPTYSPQLLDQLKEVQNFLSNGNSLKGKEAEIVINESIRAKEKVRVFISHKDSAKKAAHLLGERLKNFGFSCFVAHDTIEPMLQ